MKPVWSMTKCSEMGDLVLIKEVPDHWYGHPLYVVEPGDNEYCMEAHYKGLPVFEVLRESHVGMPTRWHLIITSLGHWIHFTSDGIIHKYTGRSKHVPPGNLIILEPIGNDNVILDGLFTDQDYLLMGHTDWRI